MDDKCSICVKVEGSVGNALVLCDYDRASWFGSWWRSSFLYSAPRWSYWKGGRTYVSIAAQILLLGMITKKCRFFICGRSFGELGMYSFIAVSFRPLQNHGISQQNALRSHKPWLGPSHMKRWDSC